MKQTALYPPIEPFDSGWLPVSHHHSVYYEQCGNPQGQPILFLHGGPGSNISEIHRRFFDPTHYRVVLFDQRGCGRSRPLGSIVENTTQDLVADIEKLRIELGIETWTIFGGSWGSTLALYYAIEHTSRVTGLIVRGVFFVSERELQWFYQDGASRFFPEDFERFQTEIREADRHDMIGAYNQLLNGPNMDGVEAAAVAWCQWEASASFLVQRKSHVEKFTDPAQSVPFAKIENHYFANLGFFKTPNEILSRISCLADIRLRIIQGRYDLVCPLESAWRLHRALPKSEYVVVDQSGHSAFEEAINGLLVEAADDFRIRAAG